MGIQSIVEPHSGTALFITLGLKSTDQTEDTVRDLCDRLPSIENSMRLRFPDNPISIVFALSSHAWDVLFPNAEKPKELQPFEPISGPKRKAISTPGDLFFHLKSERLDVCVETARLIHELLEDVSEPIDETHGFRYFDGRAIIGFVDGTENPVGNDAAQDGYVGDEDPTFAGGSYVFTQKYIHDMDYWNSLTIEEQQKAIGRRKLDDLELDDADKDQNAHTTVSKAYRKNGDEAKILRANMPFAEPSKGLFGTFFIGYSASFEITKTMLTHMFKGSPEGNYDRLLDFSEPITGAVFFVPSPSLLDSIASGDF